MTSLQPPVGPHDHMQGTLDAPVTLVEYGDYQCPDCGAAFPVVQKMQEQMGARLCFVYRNYPLADVHPHAEHAAEAAEAAAAQDRFWPMHDSLYMHQRALGDTQLVHYAEQIGADGAAITQALAGGTYKARVQEDIAGGDRSGIQGTPTFYINGVRFDGDWTSDELAVALQSAAA